MEETIKLLHEEYGGAAKYLESELMVEGCVRLRAAQALDSARKIQKCFLESSLTSKIVKRLSRPQGSPREIADSSTCEHHLRPGSSDSAERRAPAASDLSTMRADSHISRTVKV
eukprot:555155-Hanusia_phi.AAC.3